MNKARKKTYKRGFARRLVNESFVLSLTRGLSARFVHFFELGLASLLLKSYKSTDSFVREKITGPVFKRLSLRDSFIKPLRNAAASFFANNAITKGMTSLIGGFLHTSVRSVGIFSLTFGIYAAALFLLKSYVSLSFGVAASTTDISVSAVSALIGLLFIIFGDKTIVSALGGGRIIGSLLSRCLGVNASSLEQHKNARPKTEFALSFLLGSIGGIATVFLSPSQVLLVILSLLITAGIMSVPEFGLLLAAFTFSFVSVKMLSVIAVLTLVSFLFKCIRLKRNLSFGTADALMLLAAVLMLAVFAAKDGISQGEGYILCFTTLYFAAKNLLVSETLVIQSFNTLCAGLNLGMTLYILGDFEDFITHTHFKNAARILSAHTLSPEMLALSLVSLLPFALVSFSNVDKRRSKKGFILLSAVCLVITDSSLFYMLVLVSLFVYIAFAYKAPAGALLGAAAIIPTVALYTHEHALSSAVSMGARLAYDSSLAHETAASTSFWSTASEIGGGITVVLVVIAILLILQRLFGTGIGEIGTVNTRYVGTVAASVISFCCCSFILNSFSDLRVYAMLCFVLGLCGGLYKTISVIKCSEEV